MTTSHLEDLGLRIEHLIQSHLADCRRVAHAAMARAFAAHRPAKAPRRSVAPAVASASRRTAAEMQAVTEKFYAAVCADPGESMTVLAAKLGLSPVALHRPVGLLRKAKRIRSVGERQRTRYFPVVAPA